MPQKQPPRRVPRAGEPDFDGDSKYAIVSSDGKAVNVTGPGWQNHIKVEAAYQEDGNKIFDEKAQFIIKPTEGTDLASSDITAEEGEVIVQITCPIGGDVYPFRVEGGNDYAFADSDGRYDKKPEIYVIKADSGKSGACTIKAASNGRYATVDNGELRFNAGTGEEQAERFRFCENPEVVDAAIRFEHKAHSGKYIKTYQTEGESLTVDGGAEESGTAFSKVVFGTNGANTVDGQTFVTAALVSDAYGNGIKSFAGNPDQAEPVTAINNIAGNGWESVRIFGNGDGTISFKDCCTDQYITVQDNQLMCRVLPRETTVQELTDNEKFVVHTGAEHKPDSIMELTAEAGSKPDTVKLTWTNPKSLFTGVEIWQKKTSEGDAAYTLLDERAGGAAGDEASYTVKGLEKATSYTFKIKPVLVYTDADGEQTLESDEFSGEASAETGVSNAIQFAHKKSGKYIKTYAGEGENGTGEPLTVDGDAEEEGTAFSKVAFGKNSVDTVDELTFATVSLVSQDYENGVGSVFWYKDGGQMAAEVRTAPSTKTSGDGWETIRILANGDGTISFKDSCYDQYITVKDNHLVGGQFARELTAKDLTDNEKFVVHTETERKPDAARNLAVPEDGRTPGSVELTWENPESLLTGIEIWQKKASENDDAYMLLDEQAEGAVGDTASYTVMGLEKATAYSFKIRPIFTYMDGGEEKTLEGDFSDSVTVETRAFEKPKAPENVEIELKDGAAVLSWDAVENITDYRIYHAAGRFCEYKAAKEDIPAAEGRMAVPVPEGTDKNGYYRITAVRKYGNDGEEEESDQSETVSWETQLFGDHTIILSPEDDTEEVDKFLKKLFDRQNDYNADAQFNGEQWQIYFKPGDYTENACMYLGFYTAFNGLGKTPYDVKLNNIAIPAYLPKDALGGGGNNATCNFWRSAENLSVIATGNEQGKAAGSSRPDAFNWAVAQAAPLRRVYSERPAHYDWNYGWASGGYVADCLISGVDGEGNGSGTFSGQQFFTRNSRVKGNIFGTTLNNFFMGVEAANNLNSITGEPLRKGNGYTNWGIAKPTDNGQQVFTEITNTPQISEKPFLYLDGDEYKVFVPAVRKNTRGVSWGEGKANGGMGEGKSLSLLEDFYIAKPEDKAATINQKIADGFNIYFTPGIYHAETPIVVNRENAILLGTGMASIIPDNGEMALRVGDKGGIRIEGLIFDAGTSSKLLVQVGTEGRHTDHSANPIILQDLFFRVGGTTDVLTKADDALEINSDDVLCDHFWIWRADHGAGVEWYGNESKHGLIVNGDRVKCYALFNEHFQEYHTLWNGEDGETYFYQNETCYDPISQEAWMSHNGTVKGYSSYKVGNDVERHYAVGLGVYNVFIYTGRTYDGTGIGIQLDNAIEVPNKEGVMVENACTQTFANDVKSDGTYYPLSSINHIVNGVGGRVSSGKSDEVMGEGWSRKFLLYYHNGEAKFGKETDGSAAQKNKFIGTETVSVEPPADEEIYLERIVKLYDRFSDKTEKDYTANSWKRADMANVLRETKDAIDMGELVKAEMEAGKKYTQPEVSALQTKINKACTTLESASEKLVYVGEAKWQQEKYKAYQENNYTADSWTGFAAARTKLTQVLDKAEQADYTTTKDIYLLQVEIDEACQALLTAAENLSPNSTISVTGVTLNETELSIRKGNTFRLMAVTAPVDATNQKVTWSSGDEKIVSVDENGEITAQEKGTTDVTVTTEDGGYTAVCKVTVTVEEVDMARNLKTLISQCEALQAEEYTAASWKPFADALKAAKDTAAKEDASKEEIDGALVALVDARDALVKLETEEPESPENPEKPVKKEQLRELIKRCGTLNQENYAPDSWEAFAETLKDAKAVAANGEAVQKDVDEAVEKLTLALEKLRDCRELWALDIADVSFTGKAVKLVVTVYCGGIRLTQGRDYTISYKNNTKVTAGAQAIVKGKGNYGGNVTKVFRIVPIDLGAENIQIPNLYAGAPKKGKSVKPAPVVMKDGKKVSPSNYTVTDVSDEDGNYVDRITAPGVYTVEVSGVEAKGYRGSKVTTLTVANSEQVLMSAVKVSNIKKQPYTGQKVTPEFTVKHGRNILTPDKDYIVICNSREVGDATAVIRGTGEKYVGEKTVRFKITGVPLQAKNVTVNTEAKVYTGEPIETDVDVAGAAEGVDYEVIYDRNTKVGMASVTVQGIGKYTGKVKRSFRILPFDIKKNVRKKFVYNQENLSASYTKGGSKLTASDLNITYNGRTLSEGVDYTLIYASNKKTGEASVKIKGKGNFKGTTSPVGFTVTQQDLANLTIYAEDIFEKNAVKYDRVIPVVKDLDGKNLKRGTDFTVAEYKKVTVEGEKRTETDVEGLPAVGDVICVKLKAVYGSNYRGLASTDFRVIKNIGSIAKAKVTVNPQYWTGEAITFSEKDAEGEKQIFVTMQVDDRTLSLKEGRDYEIIGFFNNVNRGTGKMTIRGINRYGGVKTVSFKIKATDVQNMKWYKDPYDRAVSEIEK